MAYSCWAALSATYRTLSRSFPNGRCGPCFSRMPNGSRHVPCARAMASRNSAAASSSQCTESLLCADGCEGAGEDAGDCPHTIEAQSALMESSSDLYKGPPCDGFEPLADVTTAPLERQRCCRGLAPDARTGSRRGAVRSSGKHSDKAVSNHRRRSRIALCGG